MDMRDEISENLNKVDFMRILDSKLFFHCMSCMNK